jgi:hypothetical protein
MLKLFKAKKTTEQIIAEIHSEFDSASEKLLQEAKDIIIKDNDKGDRLARLGFSSAKPVKENEDVRKAQRDSRYVSERVSYFNQWYPHNKFITEEAVEKICGKYGLVCASANFYKGDVPEKNLVEMEQFVLRKEDEVIDLMSGFVESFRSRLLGFHGEEFMSYASNEGRSTRRSFKICAPEKDFDTSRLTKQGHKMELSIPDPIVLQPVKGGYLIVTKWGLEASDDLVKNEKSN